MADERLYRADVARLRGVEPGTVTKLLARYPAGHEHEFPAPDGRTGGGRGGGSPWWSADRRDELLDWTGPGQGTGGGRPRSAGRDQG